MSLSDIIFRDYKLWRHAMALFRRVSNNIVKNITNSTIEKKYIIIIIYKNINTSNNYNVPELLYKK